MNKKIIITISTILGLTVVVGGFLIFQKTRNQGMVNNQQKQKVEVVKNNENESKQEIENQEKDNQSNQEKVEELKVEDIDTSNWKDYCNQEYGFCVKYPEGWEYGNIYEDNKSWSIGFSEKNKQYEYEGGGFDAVEIYISFKENESLFKKRLKKWQEVYGVKVSEVYINNIKGYYYTGFGEGIIIPQIENKNFEVSISSIIMTTDEVTKDVRPVLQGMIESFKFTK